MHKTFLQLFSFVCVALGQPAFFSWLGPIAASIGIALHWRALEGFSLRSIKKISFAWFFSIQLVQSSWMVNLEYQGLYIIVLYVLLAAALAWQFSFLTKIAHQNLRFDGFFILYLASFWAFLEWIRLYIFCGFSFNFLGIALSWSVYSLQLASLFGILGMSFWVILTNLTAWQFFRTPSWKSALRCGFLTAIPYLYGTFQVNYQDVQFSRSERGVHSALLVQPALMPSQKYRLRGREEEFVHPFNQWRGILALLPSRKEPLDLIAFPEAVVPFGLDLYVYSLQSVQNLMLEHLGEEVLKAFPPLEAPFGLEGRVSNAYIFQTLSQFFQTPVIAGLDFQTVEGSLHNSAFYFEPHALFPKRYDKRILLPLAEYMPFSFLKDLSRYYGIEEFFTPGKEPSLFSEGLKISPLICYEELFPSLVREGRRKGAELFVSLSNDGYYPSSKLPVQHFTHALIRTVENGIPLIRSCNTGVTSAIDGLGRIVGKLEDEKGDVEKVAGCLLVKVPSYQFVTGFSLWGDLPLIGMSLAMTFFVYRRKFLERMAKKASLVGGGV